MVIAIIAILVCMLLPSLNSARDMAKRIGCASNMRQIGQQLYVYVSENNEIGPVIGNANFMNLLATGDSARAESEKPADKPFPRGAYFCVNAKSVPGATTYRSSYGLTLCETGYFNENAVGGGWYADIAARQVRRFGKIGENSAILVEGVMRIWYSTNAYGVPSYSSPTCANNYLTYATDAQRYQAPGYENHRTYANFLFKGGNVSSIKAGTQFYANSSEKGWSLR